MSFPIIIAAAGLGGLLLAGHKSNAPAAPSGGAPGAQGISATPTQSSTNGAKGGATSSSHSDVNSAPGGVSVAGGTVVPEQQGMGVGGATPTAPVPPPEGPKVGTLLTGPLAESLRGAPAPAPVSTTSTGVTVSYLPLAKFASGVTTRVAGDEFERVSSYSGAIY